jgi:hypothetical protein
MSEQQKVSLPELVGTKLVWGTLCPTDVWDHLRQRERELTAALARIAELEGTAKRLNFLCELQAKQYNSIRIRAEQAEAALTAEKAAHEVTLKALEEAEVGNSDDPEEILAVALEALTAEKAALAAEKEEHEVALVALQLICHTKRDVDNWLAEAKVELAFRKAGEKR